MKEFFLIFMFILIIFLGVMTGFSTQKVKNLDGKILTDNRGNYYLVKANVGDTVFLEPLMVEEAFK